MYTVFALIALSGSGGMLFIAILVNLQCNPQKYDCKSPVNILIGVVLFSFATIYLIIFKNNREIYEPTKSPEIFYRILIRASALSLIGVLVALCGFNLGSGILIYFGPVFYLLDIIVGFLGIAGGRRKKIGNSYSNLMPIVILFCGSILFYLVIVISSCITTQGCASFSSAITAQFIGTLIFMICSLIVAISKHFFK